MLRTHTCGELNKNFKDQEVTLCGWVHRRRDQGKLIFIDIRDRYGITQVVFVKSVSPEAHQVAEKLGPEFVVKITGKVSVRPPKNANFRTASYHQSLRSGSSRRDRLKFRTSLPAKKTDPLPKR